MDVVLQPWFWGGKVKKTQPAWVPGHRTACAWTSFPSQALSIFEIHLSFSLVGITVPVVEQLSFVGLAGQPKEKMALREA